MAEPSNDLVWERVKELVPVHDCGRRMEPGGDPVIGHVLVCTNCSYFVGVDPEWVDAVVAEARAAIAAESN